tara:strand:+ start:2220 stop:2684 length:465 start_codon:yes stop_codon:yes gene_type:complete
MDEKQIKNLIIRVLENINLHSEEAENLVFRTGMVESGYRYIRQLRGPARGFFQCEPWVSVDICNNYLKYRPDLMKQVSKAIKVNLSHFTSPVEADWDFLLETNLAAQIAMCRLHYRRIPKALPKTLKGQAAYWKKYYNSSAGRGTVEDFLERVA